MGQNNNNDANINDNNNNINNIFDENAEFENKKIMIYYFY